MSRNFILKASVEAGLQEIRNSAQHNSEVLNQPMRILQIRTNLLNKLVVPDNSDTIEVARKYFEDYGKFVEYIESKTQEFPNIGLHAEEA